VPARQPPPQDILEAITRHLEQAHQITTIDLGELGKPGSRSTRLRVEWHNGADWTDAWFRCKRCTPGFDRYLVDVDQDEPSSRMLPLIAAHLASHEITLATVDELGTRANPKPDQKAYYTPPHAGGPASIICPTCRERGFNPIAITDPPYGDARRLALLRRRHATLLARISVWSSADQAAHLDALDQELLDRPAPAAARRALDGAHQPVPRPNLKNDALVAWMAQREAAGERVHAIIQDIAEQSRSNPIGFACEIGEQLIRLGALRRHPKQTPKTLAQRVGRTLDLPLGKLPTTSTRTLYRLRHSRRRD
jgi:hypothetical protein